MRQAILPEHMEGPSIDGMMVGESAWTVPWAMCADSNRALWLNGAYPIYREPGGTVAMRVERRSDGYHVWRVEGHRYHLSVSPPQPSEVPVAELHDADPRGGS